MIPSTNAEECRLNSKVKNSFLKNIGSTFTPVQQQAVDHFLFNDHGLIVRAETGSGKTLAFGLPVFHALASQTKREVPYVNTVVFAPTRDLAVQSQNNLSQVWKECSSHLGGRTISLVTGKIPMRAQIRDFEQRNKPPIVIATPGRFIDLLENNRSFREAFKGVQHVVIDEADELLNQNFKQDLEVIFNTLREISVNEKKFKTMLFSATLTDDVFQLADNVIGEGYKFIDANPKDASEVNKHIKQTLVVSKSLFGSFAGAVKFVADNYFAPNFKPIVFLPNTYSVDFFHELVKVYLFKANPKSRPQVFKLHGKMTQGERNFSQKRFREFNKAVMVGSNVIARGMDFPSVSHVLQIGVSQDVKNYTHRIGRTGRAGKDGEAIMFATEFEMGFVRKLQENGNSFHVEETYEADPVFEESLRECVKHLDFESIASANLGIYMNLPRELRPQKREVVAACAGLYRDLKGSEDPEDKPFLSASVAERLAINDEYSREHFDIPGRASYRKQNYRDLPPKKRYGDRYKQFRDNNYSSQDRSSNNRSSYSSQNYNRSGSRNRDRYSSSSAPRDRTGTRNSDF